jgi:hypothetical protein
MYEQQRKGDGQDFNKFKKQMQQAITGNKEKQKIQSVKIEQPAERAWDKRTGAAREEQEVHGGT